MGHKNRLLDINLYEPDLESLSSSKTPSPPFQCNFPSLSNKEAQRMEERHAIEKKFRRVFNKEEELLGELEDLRQEIGNLKPPAKS